MVPSFHSILWTGVECDEAAVRCTQRLVESSCHSTLTRRCSPWHLHLPPAAPRSMAVLSACSVHVTYVTVAACMAADGLPALAAAHPSAAGALSCRRRCMSQGCRRSEGRRMSAGQAHVHRHAEVMDQQVRAQHRRSDYGHGAGASLSTCTHHVPQPPACCVPLDAVMCTTSGSSHRGRGIAQV